MAENEARFRDANERIEREATRLGFHLESEVVPFLCECGDETCTTIVRMSLVDYEGVRAESTHFLAAPGHETVAERTHTGHAVRQRGDYVVVEKDGEAAAIADWRDPRRRGERA